MYYIKKVVDIQGDSMKKLEDHEKVKSKDEDYTKIYKSVRDVDGRYTNEQIYLMIIVMIALMLKMKKIILTEKQHFETIFQDGSLDLRFIN